MKTTDLIAGLPGEALVREGVSDLRSGRRTIPAWLVAIGSTRLAEAGVIEDGEGSTFKEPELQLYRVLLREGGDAYSRYNALLRELVSFEQALDHRRRKSQTEDRKQTQGPPVGDQRSAVRER